MADVLRWLIIVEALVLVGGALAVLQEARRFRAPERWVYLAAGSYIALVSWGALETHARLGEPLNWWRALDGLAVLTLGIGTMGVLFHHYRLPARRRRHGERSEEAARRLLERER